MWNPLPLQRGQRRAIEGTFEGYKLNIIEGTSYAQGRNEHIFKGLLPKHTVSYSECLSSYINERR